MKRTLVLCVSWKGPIEQTAKVLSKLRGAGAAVIIYTGMADVSLARSRGITIALEAIDNMPEPQPDTILMLDDDVEPTVGDAATLIAVSRVLKRPVSGCYGMTNGKLAAGAHPLRPDRFLTGLGFIAVPVAALEDLSERLPVAKHGEDYFHPFCCTGFHPETLASPAAHQLWVSEDYWLCLSLGGVELAPIPANHWKLSRIVPSVDSLSHVERDFNREHGLRLDGPAGDAPTQPPSEAP